MGRSRSAEPQPEGLVSIWCDDPSHDRTLLVAQFYPAHGAWQEWRSRARRGTEQAALVGDEPFDRDRHRGRAVRYRDRIECRKYKQCGRAVPARQEKLFAVLDTMAAAGERHANMSALAASLGRITN